MSTFAILAPVASSALSQSLKTLRGSGDAHALDMQRTATACDDLIGEELDPDLSEEHAAEELIHEFEAQHRQLVVQGDLHLARWLLAKVPLGMESQIEQLVSRYNRLLHFTAFRVLQNYDLAQDAVQESWMRAYRAMIKFVEKQEEERLYTLRMPGYMVMIVHNTAYSMLEYDRKFVPLDLSEESPFLRIESRRRERPEVVAIRRDNVSELLALIQHLPPKFAAVFERRYFLDWSYEQIASDLDMPKGTVAVYLSRGRSLLFGSLEFQNLLRDIEFEEQRDDHRWTSLVSGL